MDHPIVLIVYDGGMVLVALHALDRRPDDLPDAEREHVHDRMPGGAAGARLVPDLVLVDVGAAAVPEQGRLDRTPEMQLDLAAAGAGSDRAEVRVVRAAERHPDRAAGESAAGQRGGDDERCDTIVMTPTRKVLRAMT